MSAHSLTEAMQDRGQSERVIVVGGSLGALDGLRRLAAELPGEFPAPITVTVHLRPDAPAATARLLDRAGPLSAATVFDEQELAPGRIYVAPPNLHLVVEPGKVRPVLGPRENLWRPSIDVLFRSAAIAYGPGTIAVLLSGYLDDGVAGLDAVRRCGGTVVVQDPRDATVPDLPQNALGAVAADHVSTLAGLPKLLVRLAEEPLATSADPPPDDLITEHRIAARVTSDVAAEFELGELAPFSCPECRGPLWGIDGPVKRYRCHVGHAYTGKSLAADQQAGIERALWAALRALREQSMAQESIARTERADGRPGSAAAHRELAEDARRHAGALAELTERILEQGRLDRRAEPSDGGSQPLEPVPGELSKAIG